MTQTTPWPVARLSQAIGDPQSIVGRLRGPSRGAGHPDYAPAVETYRQWALRAVLHVLDEFDRELAKRLDNTVRVIPAEPRAKLIAVLPPIHAVYGLDNDGDQWALNAEGQLVMEGVVGAGSRPHAVVEVVKRHGPLTWYDAAGNEIETVSDDTTSQPLPVYRNRGEELRGEMAAQHFTLPVVGQVPAEAPRIYADIADRMPPGVPAALRDEFPAELGGGAA